VVAAGCLGGLSGDESGGFKDAAGAGWGVKSRSAQRLLSRRVTSNEPATGQSSPAPKSIGTVDSNSISPKQSTSIRPLSDTIIRPSSAGRSTKTKPVNCWSKRSAVERLSTSSVPFTVVSRLHGASRDPRSSWRSAVSVRSEVAVVQPALLPG
jgi:hypothetical protein